MSPPICQSFCRGGFIAGIILLFATWYLFHDIDVHFSPQGGRAFANVFPDPRLPKNERVKQLGFSFEEHKVTTEDKYIITLWRIFLSDNIGKFKKSVLLNHGLLDNGYSFIARGKNESLAFILASEGYDVWIMHNRGSLFSQDSENKVADYWDFTFEEMARYDVTSAIQYMVNVTKSEKISLVCHSQGCIQFFIGYTFNPIFFDKHVEKVAVIGTVLSYVSVNKFFLKILKHLKILEILDYIGINNLLKPTEANVKYCGYFCYKMMWFCRGLTSLIIENEPTEQFDYHELYNLFYNEPGGTSTKNLIHWVQIIGKEDIRRFDYGEKENLARYGSPIPPKYNFEVLNRLKMDMFMLSSDSDPYCKRKEFDQMVSLLQSAKITLHHAAKYNHCDYVWGRNANQDIYSYIVQFFENKN